jgi:hypothetical protein
MIPTLRSIISAKEKPCISEPVPSASSTPIFVLLSQKKLTPPYRAPLPNASRDGGEIDRKLKRTRRR